jgi:hypothetical protein
LGFKGIAGSQCLYSFHLAACSHIRFGFQKGVGSHVRFGFQKNIGSHIRFGFQKNVGSQTLNLFHIIASIGFHERYMVFIWHVVRKL